MDEFYHKHYIRIREDGAIMSGWSDGPQYNRTPTENDILLNDKGGYQFRLIIDGKPTTENPTLFDFDMIPLYKWDSTQVLLRTEEEIQADRDALPPPPPAPDEDRDAMIVDHELRLTMLELGV